MKGVVIKKSGDKTVTVEVTRVSRHSRYGKKTVSTRRWLVHDPDNRAVAGQWVVFRPTRPLSARKRWVVV